MRPEAPVEALEHALDHVLRVCVASWMKRSGALFVHIVTASALRAHGPRPLRK